MWHLLQLLHSIQKLLATDACRDMSQLASGLPKSMHATGTGWQGMSVCLLAEEASKPLGLPSWAQTEVLNGISCLKLT